MGRIIVCYRELCAEKGKATVRSRHLISILTNLMLLGGGGLLVVEESHGDPRDLETFSNFDTINTPSGVPFSIGSAPARATFAGNAFSGIIGVTELYRSGLQAWMINPGGTGTITFETSAAEVEFFARTRSIASGNTVITAFDANDVVVGSPVTLQPGPPFQLISFSGSIARIEVENLARGPLNSNVNSIDDFGFTPLSPLAGDFNGNGVVDAADYTIWRDTLGSQVDLRADGDGDGTVRRADYELWKSNFGSLAASGGSSSSISIPEPVTLQLLASLSLLALCRRRMAAIS